MNLKISMILEYNIIDNMELIGLIVMGLITLCAVAMAIESTMQNRYTSE